MLRASSRAWVNMDKEQLKAGSADRYLVEAVQHITYCSVVNCGTTRVPKGLPMSKFHTHTHCWYYSSSNQEAYTVTRAMSVQHSRCTLIRGRAVIAVRNTRQCSTFFCRTCVHCRNFVTLTHLESKDARLILKGVLKYVENGSFRSFVAHCESQIPDF
jgi:hypothetical protein